MSVCRARPGPLALVLCSVSCAVEASPPSVATDLGALATDETVVPVTASGRTDRVRVPVRGSTAIQVTPAGTASEETFCYQLEDVVDGHGVELVARADNRLEWGRTCLACSQRVSVGHGFGWFVLPNDGREHDFGDHLDLVVSVRDCATLLPVEPSFDQVLPEQLRVRTFAFAPKQGRPALDLFAATTADSGLGRDGEPWLARVVELAAAYLAPDGPALVLRASTGLALAPGRIRFGDGEQSAMDEIHHAARTAADARGLTAASLGIIIFAKCLEHIGMDGSTADIQGYAPRIPGGGGDGLFADGIFVSTAGCATGARVATPERAAKTLAHELGHFLGLYHTVEPSGTQDLLSDSDNHNLMNHLPDAADSAGLSAQQVFVMRSHPYVYGSTPGAH